MYVWPCMLQMCIYIESIVVYFVMSQNKVVDSVPCLLLLLLSCFVASGVTSAVYNVYVMLATHQGVHNSHVICLTTML